METALKLFESILKEQEGQRWFSFAVVTGCVVMLYTIKDITSFYYGLVIFGYGVIATIIRFLFKEVYKLINNREKELKVSVIFYWPIQILLVLGLLYFVFYVFIPLINLN